MLPVSAPMKDVRPQLDLNAGVSGLGHRPQESPEMIRLMWLAAERSTDGGDAFLSQFFEEAGFLGWRN